MNLTISGHHIEVTDALRHHVNTKIARIARHFDQVVDARVILTVDKIKDKDKSQKAECNIFVKGQDLFAEASHHDMYAAIDILIDKLDRQVSKYKEKLQDVRQHDAMKRVISQ
jgi:putative sigma-54 modulation protein